MGILNKLKNVLFEEEEIEIPEAEMKEEKVVHKPDREIKKRDAVKMTFDGEEEDILSDRELFKAEPTFNFPLFDEQEFESIKKEEPVVSNPKVYEKQKEVKARPKTSPVSVMDVEAGRSSRVREVETRYEKPTRKPREVTPVEKRKFTPSPVISPVYGVLDKNYKKEDIVVKVEDKKVIDVDSVRKKAFGTLEEDIEKTLTTPRREFYHEVPKREEKDLDELLKDVSDEIISVANEEPIDTYSSFNIEDEPIEEEVMSQELEVLDRPKVKNLEEQLADETLENDLFDLIDSMYETREDGEIKWVFG